MTRASETQSTRTALFVAVPDALAAEWASLVTMPAETGDAVDGSAGELHSVADLPAAAALLADGTWSLDLVVVYQGIPDQFAAADVDAFVGRIPLSRCVVVFGPWCESIGRTEQVWPIGWCVPLQHAAVRLRQEVAAWQHDEPPLPPTTSRDEAFVRSTVQTLRGADGLLAGQTVRVTSLDRAFGQFLTEAVQTLGAALPTADVPADIELFATTLIDESALRDITRVRAAAPQARLFVVTEMATPSDARDLTAAGCDGVLSQLRFIEQLADVMQPK